jgi:hypothetical protein
MRDDLPPVYPSLGTKYYQSQSNSNGGGDDTRSNSSNSRDSTPCLTRNCLITTSFILLTLGLGAITYGGIQLNNWKNSLNANVCDNTYVALPLEIGQLYSNGVQLILWNINLPNSNWNCTTFQKPPLPTPVVGEEHLLYVNDNNNRCSVWEEDTVDCSDCDGTTSSYMSAVIGFGFGAAVWCLSWIVLFIITLDQCCCGNLLFGSSNIRRP